MMKAMMLSRSLMSKSTLIKNYGQARGWELTQSLYRFKDSDATAQ